ncbi:MAG: helix-turn-helix domain-containing protein [Anaerolineales bacterium]
MAAPPSGLKEITHLVFEKPVVWLHGEPGYEIAVNWATISLDGLKPGDLLIIQAVDLMGDTPTAAKERGAVAVLVLGETVSIPIQSPDDFPLLHAPGAADLRMVQRRVLEAIVHQRAVLMERGVRMHTQFSQLIAEGNGLPGLAHAIADISGCGVLVQDKRGRILTDLPSASMVGIWDVVLEQLSSLNSLPGALLDRKRTGIQTGLVTQEIPGNLARLVSPITVSSIVRGYLSLVGLKGEFDALDHLVVEQGALVCAIEMSRKKAIRETEKRLKGDLLAALLQETLSPRDAELWVQTMGLDVEQAHIALRFIWDGENPPSRRRLETIVNGEVTRKKLKVILKPLGLEVICFCQVPPQVNRAEPALSLGMAVIEQAKTEYPDTPVRCGVGTTALELSEWRDSFRQAGQALAMARRFSGRKPLYFPDLSVYRLLLQIEHNPELITFQEETLGPLSSHENCAEMTHTLEAYFEHNGNISRTAEALFIHRNTLIYRMERIISIINLDLDNPENRLAVQLALHIFRMKGHC